MDPSPGPGSGLLSLAPLLSTKLCWPEGCFLNKSRGTVAVADKGPGRNKINKISSHLSCRYVLRVRRQERRRKDRGGSSQELVLHRRAETRQFSQLAFCFNTRPQPGLVLCNRKERRHYLFATIFSQYFPLHILNVWGKRKHLEILLLGSGTISITSYLHL